MQRSKRKQQIILEKKAWVPKILVYVFQNVHGNGKDTWSRFDASTKQDNLISEDLVNQLDLETIRHLRPYPLGWICKNENL